MKFSANVNRQFTMEPMNYLKSRTIQNFSKYKNKFYNKKVI